MSLIKALFNVVTGEKVAAPRFQKSKLNNDLASDNISSQQSQQMNAVINEFKLQSQTNIALDGNEDFMSDANSMNDGPISQFNELSLLTKDQFFPSPLKLIEFPNKKSFLFGTRPPLIARDDEKLRNIIRTVDFTRITNRIILGGLFWKNQSSRKHRRNNIDEGAAFLKARFRNNYMIWNLAKGVSQCEYDFSIFDNQVVSYKLSKSSDCNISTLIDTVRSIDAWLSLDFANVAIIHCVKGTYSALAAACWLIYAGFFDDGMEALEFVCARRKLRLNIGVYRYAMYFANIIATNGEVPNRAGILMERLSVHGFTNIKKKRKGKIGIEVFEKDTSVFKQYGSTSDDFHSQKSNSLVPITNCMFQYQNTLIFDLMFYKSLNLRNEVRIKLNNYDDHGEVIEKLFQFSFHTGYMPPGVIRILKKDIDWYVASKEMGKFSLEIDLRGADDDFVDMEEIDYEPALDREILACLAVVVANHFVIPDPRLLHELTSLGHGRSKNKIEGAYKVLKKLARSALDSVNDLADDEELFKIKQSNDVKKSDSILNMGESISKLIKNDSSASLESFHKKRAQNSSQESLWNSSTSISHEDMEPINKPLYGQRGSSLKNLGADKMNDHSKKSAVTWNLKRDSYEQYSSNSAKKSVIGDDIRDLAGSRERNENSFQSLRNADRPQVKPPKSPARIHARKSDPNQNRTDIDAPLKLSARIDSRKSDSHKTILEGDAFSTKWADEWISTINNLLASRENMTSNDFDSFNLPVYDEEIARPERMPLGEYGNGDRLGTIDHSQVDTTADSNSGDKKERNSGSSSLILQNLLGSESADDINRIHPVPLNSDKVLSRTIANLQSKTGMSNEQLLLELEQLVAAPLNSVRDGMSLTVANLRDSRNNEQSSASIQTSPVDSLEGGLSSSKKMMISSNSVQTSDQPTPKQKLVDPRERSASLSKTQRPPSPAAPPAAPPPPLAPPPPVAPPPPMAPVGANESTGKKKMVKNRLHWSIIRNIDDESVWSQLDYDMKLDVQKFEELFCVIPGAKTKNTNIVQRAQYNSFLETRRSNNILIGLSRFTRRGLTPEMLVDAISRMDENSMDADDLVTYQALLPTFEERKLINSALSGPTNAAIPFAPAESFLIEVAKIDDLPFQVLAFVFKLQLKFESDELIERLDIAIHLCFELRSSVRLKKLLKLVLELGNLTNYDYGAGNSSFRPWMGKNARAAGFKIDGLARLRDVKSADGKWSLITFLVDMIQKTYPELLGLEDSFSSLTVVKSFDFREFYIQFLTMEATEKKLKSHSFQDKNFQTILNQFLSKSREILKELKQKFVTFTQTWQDTLQYFGEDPSEHYNIINDHNELAKEGKKSPIYIFVSLDLFFQSFKDAIANARFETEKKKNKEVSDSQRLKKLALLNSASSLDSDLNASILSESHSSSQDSLASTATIVRANSNDDVFEESELENVRRKIVHRLSSQLNGNQVIVDTNSRENTDRVLANAAAPSFELEESEFVLRRHSLLSSQSKRLQMDRKMQDVRRSINLNGFKLEEE